MLIDCKNEAEWLEKRKFYLTASDAGLYCDINPYQQNGPAYLYDLKTGAIEAPDLSGKFAVQRGKAMEPHLRSLFMIDHDEYQLAYHQFGLYVSDQYPFLAATLDGLLRHRELLTIHILEIKTATVQDKETWFAWKRGDIPQHYIAQGIHQLICVPKAESVIFWAYVVNAFTGEMIFVMREFTREELEEDMRFVLARAIAEHEAIVNRQRPRLKIAI